MKAIKTYLATCLLLALFLIFSSCREEEDLEFSYIKNNSSYDITVKTSGGGSKILPSCYKNYDYSEQDKNGNKEKRRLEVDYRVKETGGITYNVEANFQENDEALIYDNRQAVLNRLVKIKKTHGYYKDKYCVLVNIEDDFNYNSKLRYRYDIVNKSGFTLTLSYSYMGEECEKTLETGKGTQALTLYFSFDDVKFSYYIGKKKVEITEYDVKVSKTVL